MADAVGNELFAKLVNYGPALARRRSSGCRSSGPCAPATQPSHSPIPPDLALDSGE